MSSQLRSRALQEGRVKALRRMKQPLTLVLETSSGTRDPVARANMKVAMHTTLQMQVASSIAMTPPQGPLGRKNSASSRPVA